MAKKKSSTKAAAKGSSPGGKSGKPGKGWMLLTSTVTLFEGTEGKRIIVLPRSKEEHIADLKKSEFGGSTQIAAIKKADELGHVEFSYRFRGWQPFFELLKRTLGAECTESDLPTGQELEGYRAGKFDVDQFAALCGQLGMKIAYPLSGNRLSVVSHWIPAAGKKGASTGRQNRQEATLGEADE